MKILGNSYSCTKLYEIRSEGILERIDVVYSVNTFRAVQGHKACILCCPFFIHEIEVAEVNICDVTHERFPFGTLPITTTELNYYHSKIHSNYANLLFLYDAQIIS
jgi:hypothetical protein